MAEQPPPGTGAPFDPFAQPIDPYALPFPPEQWGYGAPGMAPLAIDEGRKGGEATAPAPIEPPPQTPPPPVAPVPEPGKSSGASTLGPRGRNAIGPTVAPTADEVPQSALAPVVPPPADENGAHLLGNRNATRPFAPGEWVDNPDGSWSSEVSGIVEDKRINGGKPTVVPTLWLVNGKPQRVTEDQAADYAAQSGLKFLGFDSVKDADKYTIDREAQWQRIPHGASDALPPLYQGEVPQGPTSGPPGTITPDNYIAKQIDQRLKGTTPEAIGRYDEDQKARQLAMDPVALTRANAERDAWYRAQQHKQAIEAANQAERDWEDQQQAIRITNAKQAAIDEAAAQLADRKTDPRRVFKNAGTMGTIGGVLAAIVSGIGQGLGGGQSNYALDAMHKAIEDDLDAQKEDLANARAGISQRQNSLANEVALNGDYYHNLQAKRQAAWLRMAADLQTEAQQYDPLGKNVLNLANAYQDTMARLGAARDAHIKEMFKSELDLAKERRETAAQLEIARHNKAGEALDWAKRNDALDKGSLDATVMTPEQLAIVYPGSPVPAIPMSGKQYKAWLETQKTGQEAQTATRNNAIQEHGSEIRNPVTGQAIMLGGVDKDGKPRKTPPIDPTKATEITSRLGYEQKMMDSLGKVRRFLDTDPSLVDRAEYAAAVTDFNQAKADYIKAMGANPSSREMEAMSEMFGPDFDKVKDRLLNKGTGKARIDALIQSLKRDSITDLKGSLGEYDGPSPLLDTSQTKPAAETAVDRAIKGLTITGPASGEHSAVQVQARAAGIDTPEAQESIRLGVPLKQMHILQALRARAASGDEHAHAALQAAAEGRTPGTTEELRAYALSLTSSSLSDQIPGDIPTRTLEECAALSSGPADDELEKALRE